MLRYQHECGWPHPLVKSLYGQHTRLLRIVDWEHFWQIRQLALSSGALMLLDSAVAIASRPLEAGSAQIS